MKKILTIAASVAAILSPAVAFAQSTATFQGQYVSSFLTTVAGWVPIITGILFAVAFIVFIWGVIMYVISGDAEKKASAKQTMIYGIIGLAVISLAGGIIYVLGNIFGLNSGNNSIGAPTITTPSVNINGSSGNGNVPINQFGNDAQQP